MTRQLVEKLQVAIFCAQFSTCNAQRHATRCAHVARNEATYATHPFRGVAVLQVGGVALMTNLQIFATRPANHFGTCKFSQVAKRPGGRMRDARRGRQIRGNDTADRALPRTERTGRWNETWNHC